MSLKESILAVVESGGTVSFPYKLGKNDWMDDVKVFSLFRPKLRFYTCNPRSGTEEFDDAAKAVESFLAVAISRKNLGLAIDGIRKHEMTDKDLDDLGSSKVMELCKQYFAEHFDKDFPEFAGGDHVG